MSTETPNLNVNQVETAPTELPSSGSLDVAARSASFRVFGTPFGLVLLVAGGLCLISLLVVFHSNLQSLSVPFGGLLHSTKAIYKGLIPLSLRLQVYSFRGRLLATFANPYYYLGIGAVFTLEWLFPAKREQPILSVGLAQDVFYFLFLSVVVVSVAGPYVGFLDRLYARHLAFLTIPPVMAWPFAVRAVFGLIFNDLLHWTHHYLRHRIRPLWYFHMIHHSQREMNLFADVRSHYIETFFALSVVFIPLNMFGVSFANRGWIYFVPVLYFRLYHANIRTNLGPLRYVFVTPQSHRIHHSIEQKHWDKNFGFIFTFWDHVFGTQYKNYDEYPDTGVDDVNFPTERTYPGVVRTLLVQLWYPFKQLVQKKA